LNDQVFVKNAVPGRAFYDGSRDDSGLFLAPNWFQLNVHAVANQDRWRRKYWGYKNTEH